MNAIATNSIHNSTFLPFSLSMFAEEDDTTINIEDKKEFEIRKNAKVYSILLLSKSSKKNHHF